MIDVKNRADLEDEDDKTVEHVLTADEQKFIKQVEGGKTLEEKLEHETLHISGTKYEWFLSNLYDIDPKLGMVWKDYDQISKQRSVVFYLLKQIGSNILKGKSIMSISLPITIMEPQSMLQRLANVYTYLPAFAPKFATTTDPLERFKHYIGFSIACLHSSLQQKKPLNPVWGETYQGYLGSPEFRVYCEQTSHHPAVSNLMIDTPWFTIFATHKVEARMYPNSARVTSLGRQKVIFKDEKHTTYKVKRNPEAYLCGVILGKRAMAYEEFMEIKDVTNKLYMQARFNPEKQGFFERVFSKTTATRSDFFKGFITRNKALLKDSSRKAFYSKDMVTYFEGQWLEYVIMDGEYYWLLGREQRAGLVSQPDHLPSDSVNRTDLQALVRGNEAEAQKQKDIIEDEQRHDRKLREPFDKLRKSK